MTETPFNYSGKLAYLIAACRDPRLLRTDVAVLSVIADYANKETGRSWPSIARINDESGVPRTTALRAIKRLEDAAWITSERIHGSQTTYQLTKPVHGTSSVDGTSTTWSTTGSVGGLRTGPAHGTKVVPPTDPEQEVSEQGNRTGALGQEKNGLPNWLPADLWQQFQDHRKQIKKPMTEVAKTRAIAKLSRLKDEGHTPAEVLDQSIVNGWSGLFPIKGNSRKSEPATLPRESDEDIKAAQAEAERHMQRWNT